MTILKIDISTIEEDIRQQTQARIEEQAKLVVNHYINHSYAIGYGLKQIVNDWSQNNLSRIVEEQLNTVDMKALVEKHLEREIGNIVHNMLKDRYSVKPK